MVLLCRGGAPAGPDNRRVQKDSRSQGGVQGSSNKSDQTNKQTNKTQAGTSEGFLRAELGGERGILKCELRQGLTWAEMRKKTKVLET